MDVDYLQAGFSLHVQFQVVGIGGYGAR